MTSGKRLTVEEKARIFRLRAQGLTCKQIATRFGIVTSTVYTLVKGTRQEKINEHIEQNT